MLLSPIEDLIRPLSQRALFVWLILLVLVGAALSAFLHPMAGPVAVLALLLAPLALASVELALVGLIGVILLLPFAALPFKIGFTPTFLDVCFGLVYGIWLMRLVLRQETRLRMPPAGLLMLLFMGLMLAGFLAGLAHSRPSMNQIRVFGELLMAAGLFFAIPNLLRDEAALRRLLTALTLLAGLAAAIGLALYLLPRGLQVSLLSSLAIFDYPAGPGVLRFLNDDPGRLQRATGTSIDPNSFGGMLALMTAFTLPQAFTRKPYVPRRLAIACSALMGLALLLTVSRGSLLGLAAGLGIIGLLRDRRLLAFALAAGLGLLALAQVLPWTAAYMEHFMAGLAGQDRATIMRFGEYRDALRLIERYPLLGVGFGGPANVDLYRGVSSFYLIIAESMGLIGLFGLLAMLTGMMLRWLLAWLSMPAGGRRALILGCMAGFTAAMTSGVFDHYFFTYPHAFASLWLVAGLGMRALEEPEQDT